MVEPKWFDIPNGDMCVNLREVKMVKKWYYLRYPTIPKGIRVVFLDGKQDDTIEYTSDAKLAHDFSLIKEALKNI